MKDAVILKPTRDYYAINEAVECSMTVGELIEELNNYRSGDKIVFCNDNGYTYGAISRSSIGETSYQTQEEKRMEEITSEIEDIKYDLDKAREEYEINMADLTSQYENSEMTDEEYRQESKELLDDWYNYSLELHEKIKELQTEYQEY